MVAQFARGFGDEQSDFPMSGMKTERDGSSIGRANTAVGAENEELGIEQARRFPSHARILREAEEIAGGLRQQHLRRDGERSFGAGRVRGFVSWRSEASLSNTSAAEICLP